MAHSWWEGFQWIHLGICKSVDDFRHNRKLHDHMDLDYNMDLRNVHSYMFDRMDNHRRYNNQLVKWKLDVLELKKSK